MVGDEACDLLLGGVVAHGADRGKGLPSEALREEEAGDDDGEDDEKYGDGGAGGGVSDFRREPVVGALRDDGQHDGSDDGGEEWLEEKADDDEDAEREEKQSGPLPCRFFARAGHGAGHVPAPWRDLVWLRTALVRVYGFGV